MYADSGPISNLALVAVTCSSCGSGVWLIANSNSIQKKNYIYVYIKEIWNQWKLNVFGQNFNKSRIGSLI